MQEMRSQSCHTDGARLRSDQAACEQHVEDGISSGNVSSVARAARAAPCLQCPCARARRWQLVAQDSAAGAGMVGGSDVTRSSPWSPPSPGAAAVPLKRGSPEQRYYSYCRAEGNGQRDI